MSPITPKYEFGGPIGAAAIVLAPALLKPSTLTWEKFKAQTPWPADGIWGLSSWKATGWMEAYYFLSLNLYRVLPAREVHGTKLRESGRPLLYRFNAFHASVAQLAACAIGTYLYGSNWIFWSFITDNYLQLLTANIILAFSISAYVYLAAGGHTGNLIYDFYIGRELNPRVTFPFFGEVDIKAWLEMRPGLTGWVLLNLASVAQQHRNYGNLSDSIVVTAVTQTFCVLYGQYAEAGILSMMDIITDGLGFMLTFGDIVWVPFLYSWAGLIRVIFTFAQGLYIFYAANLQKNTLRKNPDDSTVKNLSYIQTKRGTRLLTAGWWGTSRHINYFGDWLQALPFSLPTGIAGYVIMPAGNIIADAVADSDKPVTMIDGSHVQQGAAKGWGMRRDDVACTEKYGEDWNKYKKIVRWRILPYVY
ncbi:hypothetical protein VMCG_05552 [Cytospora schulzeri]|uniref:Delta(14)-sterol reductase n=1 Tax=Cytospora schulzeri TaxID=448051 RepID=A0A423WFB7_9PEZI|nr:hypothetical protein VMCG_05552 [Valsa malicola]